MVAAHQGGQHQGGMNDSLWGGAPSHAGEYVADASSFEIFVATVVGSWAMASTVFSISEIMNKRRDAVIVGAFEGNPLTKEHKQLILRCDWLPMAAGLIFICLGGLAAAFLVSDFLDKRFELLATWLRWGSLSLFVIVGVLLPLSLIKECRSMMASIDSTGTRHQDELP